MTDDEIDRLYAGAPEEFTARRAELVAAAKKRGDKDAAKRIGAARRPTTAAWVVNVLVRNDATARDRLIDLGEELRAAHAAMDGARIRELSSTQRKLVDGLARAGFAAAGLAQPSAAVRDDVVGTLQAAIADPEVAGRLGRLSAAERWAGFGDFGAVSTVGPVPTSQSERRTQTTEPQRRIDEVAAVRERVAVARNDVEAANRQHAVAADVLTERTSNLATARRRYETLLERLGAAEGELNAADAARANAESSTHTASDQVDAAKAALAEAESELAAIVEPGGC